VDLGPTTDLNYLILFGTGIRNRTDLSAVSVMVGEIEGRVEYAGPQNQYMGLDQVNLAVPHDLKGRGIVDVTLLVDGKPANKLQVQFR